MVRWPMWAHTGCEGVGDFTSTHARPGSHRSVTEGVAALSVR